MSAPRQSEILTQRFDAAALAAAARSATRTPLRRAGPVTELVIVGVYACLFERALLPTAVLWGSAAGAGEAGLRVVADVVLKREPPYPFDFLATQPNLAAIHVRQAFDCVGNVVHQPIAVDPALHWRRMESLAAAWLRAGRCARVAIGQVEAGGEENVGRWRVVEM